MATFAEIVENVHQLSFDDKLKMRQILNQTLIEQRREQILKASKEAMKEYEEGKTISLSSPEEIKKFFNDFMNNDD